jgi:hypothetical protein
MPLSKPKCIHCRKIMCLQYWIPRRWHCLSAIDHCNDNTNGCYDTCKYLGPGLYECICLDPNAVLVDGTSCSCKSGYSGNGLYYTAINYCTGGNNGCSDICNYTSPGTYESLCSDPLTQLFGTDCICPTGYTSNGKICKEINHCTDNSSGPRIFVLILDLVLLNVSAVIQMPILQEKNVFVVLVLVAMV